jgi:carboxypeptidase Q
MVSRQLFLFFFATLSIFPVFLLAQTDTNEEDAFYIRKIYDEALTQAKCYDWLHHLSEDIGGRLAGSPEAAAAVEYTRQELELLGLDTVWLQPCMAPHWKRGEKEQVRIVNSQKMGTIELNGVALGNSVGTGPMGVTAEVVEVKSLAEVEKLGRAGIEGKIVFYNRPMDSRQIRTFNAYGGAVDQRGSGPSKAAEYGAVAAVVRSMTTELNDTPHTGSTRYNKDGKNNIPAVAISTNDAELLSRLLKEESIRIFVRTTCEMLQPVRSYNVIGEIRGSEFPDEYILVGGHLDSWDLGGGAHDDGAGCVQSMEVVHLIKQMDYRPKRSIRCVLFANEENGLAGGRAYAKAANEKGEYHMAAIESDAGGFTPRGFRCDAHEEVFKKKLPQVTRWLPLLEPYGLSLSAGGSGADISPLKNQKGILFGLAPDSQRYFDYHHTALDRIEAVNKRELELGAAAMMSLVYLLDKYGVE